MRWLNRNTVAQICTSMLEFVPSVVIYVLHFLCLQVMNAAAKLGISITVSPVGNDGQYNGSTTTTSSVDRSKEWQPTYNLDEDSLLYQLRASLVQTLDASMRKLL